MSNQINPDHGASPPPFSNVLEIIAHAQAKSTAFMLSDLVGQVPMDIQTDCDYSEKDQIRHFLELVSSASSLLNHSSGAAKDFRFDAHEKQQLRLLLIDLIKESVQLFKSFND